MSHILQNEVVTLNTIVTLVSLNLNEMLSKKSTLGKGRIACIIFLRTLSFCFKFNVFN